MKRARALLPLVAGVLTISATGCGGETPPPKSAYVVLADVSGSGQRIGLVDEAKRLLGERVSQMRAPSRATFLAFNMQVGSSTCPPVKVDLAWSDNSTEVSDNRASYVEPAKAAIDPYVECALASYSGGGTDVFGGISEAASLMAGIPGEKEIDMVTDGCHSTKSLRTCTKQVANPKWRANVLKALPAALKPHLSGVALKMYGVARGSRLQSDQVQGLRSLYSEYAAAIGATVTFEN